MAGRYRNPSPKDAHNNRIGKDWIGLPRYDGKGLQPLAFVRGSTSKAVSRLGRRIFLISGHVICVLKATLDCRSLLGGGGSSANWNHRDKSCLVKEKNLGLTPRLIGR